MNRLSALAADTLVALRQNPLRSFLSILGLVIGVAALVAILALADGMEQYARDQIGTTTNLQNVSGADARIIGVLSAPDGRPAEVYGPYTAFAAETEERPPGFYLRVVRAEEVAPVVNQVNAWLDGRYTGGREAFSIATNEQRTRQIREGMLLFKLILGLITGISVVVGGVGVMNVLLVTVTERTREIGIRKAVGARRRDILLQFLAEAMTVSGVGSLIGLIVGLLGVFAVIPVIRHLTDVSFHAALTGQTVLVVSGVALAVGVLFGTYPAIRAARLSPVEAMRHE